MRCLRLWSLLRFCLCLFLCTIFTIGGVFASPEVSYAAEVYSTPLSGIVYFPALDQNFEMVTHVQTSRYGFQVVDPVFCLPFKNDDVISFKAGNYYDVVYDFQIDTGDASCDGVMSVRLTVEGLGSVDYEFVSTDTGYFSLSETVRFYCDRDVEASYIEVEILSDGFGTVGTWYCTVAKSLLVTVTPAAEKQTEVTKGLFGQLFNKLGNWFDGLKNSIGGFFSALGDRIEGFFDKLVEDIKGLFIPSQDDLQAYSDDFQELLSARFGLLYESVEVIDGVIDGVVNASPSATVAFPGVTFQEYTILEPMDVAVVPVGFEGVFAGVRTFLNMVLVCAFVMMCRRKLDRIIMN